MKSDKKKSLKVDPEVLKDLKIQFSHKVEAMVDVLIDHYGADEDKKASMLLFLRASMLISFNELADAVLSSSKGGENA